MSLNQMLGLTRVTEIIYKKKIWKMNLGPNEDYKQE